MSDQVKTSKTGGKQPTTVERAAAAQRRSQSLIGAAAGVLVIAVTIGVFVFVRNSADETAAAPATQSSAGPRPADPQPQPSQPPAGPAVPPGVDPALQTKPVVKAGVGTLTKLTVTPLVKGNGPAVTSGQTITVNYVGAFYKTGKEFDASWGRGEPASFPIGVGQVIPGWDKGLVGVNIGSRVQLDIPAELGYGEKPEGGRPGGPLRFVVDILAAQ
jgi:peptidylprolyl isomerase